MNIATTLTAQAVHAAMIDCLYTNEEIRELDIRADNLPPDGIVVQGITNKFLLNPTRLEHHRNQVRQWITELPTEFQKGQGGGWSFLQLPMRADGKQWGEQMDAQALYVLSNALGYAKFCLDKEFWAAMPGGMPYIEFDLDAKR